MCVKWHIIISDFSTSVILKLVSLCGMKANWHAQYVMVVVVTPSSLSILLVILYQYFLGKFSVQGWFAIASPFYLLIFVRSLFLVFSSTSLRHLFLSCPYLLRP
jgi:Kef-type K+ transport system membrane component KefB